MIWPFLLRIALLHAGVVFTGLSSANLGYGWIEAVLGWMFLGMYVVSNEWTAFKREWKR